MKIPKYARYKYVNQKVFEFIKKERISSFPVNLFEIIKRNKWGLVPYSIIQERFNCDIDTVIICLKSKDGYTQYNGNNYTISFNDVTMKKDRINFTLAHEIGHIFLNHLIDFENTRISRSNLTDEENRVLENEANAFARNLLAPSALVNSLKRKYKKDIKNIFGISHEATNTRIGLLKNDTKYDIELNLYNEMLSYFSNFMYKKHCIVCDNFFVDKWAMYCPICGSNELEWEVSNMLYNDGYRLDTKRKAVVCPRCKNENVLSEGEYCHICGTHLVNKCTDENCGATADGNARFCVYCGATTTYYENGLLCDYTEYTGENLLSGVELLYDDDSDIFQPVAEEDIPF